MASIKGIASLPHPDPLFLATLGKNKNRKNKRSSSPESKPATKKGILAKKTGSKDKLQSAAGLSSASVDADHPKIKKKKVSNPKVV